MLLEHKTNDIIRKFSQENVLEALDDALYVIDVFVDIHETLNKYLENRIDEDDVEDLLDTCLDNSMGVLNGMAECSGSCDYRINKYLRQTMERYYFIKEKLECIVDWSEASIKKMDEDVCLTIAGFVFYVINEFQLYQTLECIENEASEIDMDVIFKNWLSDNFETVTERVETLFRLHNEFKPKLDFFDEHPELESPFEKIMGPAIVAIDENKAFIDENVFTVELVQSVIDGSVTPSEALNKLGIVEEENQIETIEKASCKRMEQFIG